MLIINKTKPKYETNIIYMRLSAVVYGSGNLRPNI